MITNTQQSLISDFLIKKFGCSPNPLTILDNGKIQRFRDSFKRDYNLNLWVCVYPFSGRLYFTGGDWADKSREFSIIGDEERELSKKEKAEAWKARKEAEEQEEKERQKALRAMKTAFQALPYYDDLKLLSPHPYLQRKGLLRSYICRYDEESNELIWALKGPRGEFRGCQRIQANGKKKLQTGTRKKGSFTTLYSTTTPIEQEIFACEGLATGISIFEATGHRNIVIVCVDCGNLAEALKSVISYYLSSWRLKIQPQEFAKRITIIADNDKNKAGEEGARKASEETGCFYSVVPNFGDETITDANDIHTKMGIVTLSTLLQGVNHGI